MRTPSKVFYAALIVWILSFYIRELIYLDFLWYYTAMGFSGLSIVVASIALGWYVLERAIEDGIRRGTRDEE